jgi:hypothetical protein
MMQANSIRVTFHLMGVTDTDESNPWMITQWLRPVSSPMSTAIFETEFQDSPPAALYALWHNSITSAPGTSGGFRLALPVGVRWQHTEIAARLALTPGDADHTAVFTPASTGFTGGRTGTMAIQPLALVVQKRTSTGSRKHWGRNYLPALAADFEADGRVVGGGPAAVKDALDVIWSGSWVRDATYTRNVPNSDGFSRTIESTSCGTYVGVQRRRLR